MTITTKNPVLVCGQKDSSQDEMEAIKLYGQSVSSMNQYLWHAYEVIQNTYGDIARLKPKDIYKFGETRNADNGVKTTVMQLPDSVSNEVYVSTNIIDSISSTSTNDGETLTIEGHTIDGNDLTFVTQQVTLNGQSKVTLSTPLARVSRLYNAGATELEGTIYVFDDTGVTLSAGVPSIPAQVHMMIRAGEQQTQKTATSLSSIDYYALTQLCCSINRATASANVDIWVEARQIGSVFRPITQKISLRTGADNMITKKYEPYIVVPKNSDIRVVAVSDTDNTQVTAGFNGMLLEVQ